MKKKEVLVEVKCIECTRIVGKCMPNLANKMHAIFCCECAIECEDAIASLNSEGEVWDRDAL